MGTIAQKGAYLNDTKSELKQAINNLGGSITDETTFREYVNQLDGVYDVLPKTEFQEGTEVTIENGLKGKIDFDTDDGKKIVGYGDTEQDGTPTPDNEVPIQCVTGNQDVVVSGKNKLNFSDVTLESHGVTLQIKDNYFILNGTNDGTESAFNISYYMTPFKVNSNTKLKAFQISGSASGSLVNPYFRTYTSWQNQVNVAFTSSTISDYSVEATYNTSIIGVNGGTFNNYKIGFMVANNLTNDDVYEPYHTPITYPISLGNKQLYDECYIVGSPDNWKFVDNYEKYTMTGEETINMQNQNTRFGFDLATASTDTTKASQVLAKSNYFKGIPFNDRNNSINSVYQICNGSSRSIQFNTGTMFEDKTAFTNWVRANHPYIVYLRETPIETPITDETLISQLNAWYNAQSFNGTTILESNGDLPMIIKVRGLKGE